MVAPCLPHVFPRRLLNGLATAVLVFALSRSASASPQIAVPVADRPDLEEDNPAACRGADGTVWCVYTAYQPAPPIDLSAIRQHDFDSVPARDNGDRLLLRRSADGRAWSEPIEVIEGLRRVWRPAIAAFKGGVLVLWAEDVEGNWDIYARFLRTEGHQGWSPTVRITSSPGPDFHVVCVASGGKVWVAWQAWEKDRFVIKYTSLAVDPERFRVLSGRHRSVGAELGTNHWSPAIAADVQGRVWLAWDCYTPRSYDVFLARIDTADVKPIPVTRSARFEARPSVCCDREGRVWIAYEVGDEQWGKDYTLPESWGRNRGEVDPGRGLYESRQVAVRCLVNGELKEPVPQPYAALRDRFDGQPAGRWSIPRIGCTGDGILWLTFRRHPRPEAIGGGEVWHSYVTQFDGTSWSDPTRLPQSSFLIDNRVSLLPVGRTDILALYTGDERKSTRSRRQCDVYCHRMRSERSAGAARLRPATEPAPTRPPVHPREDDDIARVRSWALHRGGVTYRLFRGEFHRHTEFTAHRDGDGTLEDMWRYALDAAQLDWMGNGDHDNGFGVEYHWWCIQKSTDLFYVPPRFVSVHSYERSNPWPNGHRNVILPRAGIRPLPRGDLKGTPESGTPDTKMLYAYLRRFGGICAAHTSATNMGTDWRDNDPVVEPVVEIFQGCRQPYQNYEHLGAPRAAPKTKKPFRFEPGFVWNALAKGYRLGFQCSSDHFSTHISYAFVLAPDCSRSSIIDAFKQRHCYGANDNIILSVTCGEHLMGDEFTLDGKPRLEVEVIGTAPIERIHIIRNNKYVYSIAPGRSQVWFSYEDMFAEPGGTYYYYVRVEQANRAMAWSSPIWIHVR